MSTAESPATRHAVLEDLKRLGPQRADALARRLGLTSMAVRQHLYILREAGLIREMRGEARRGRPPKIWDLTEAGHRRFPDRHRDVALDLVGAVRETFGPEGMERLLNARTARQRGHYLAHVGSGPLPDRVQRLAALRSEEGYMAQVRHDEDGALLLIENHCPICALAKACSGLCAQELSLFQAVLGEDCRISRTEHVIKGGRRCTYRIDPVSPTFGEAA